MITEQQRRLFFVAMFGLVFYLVGASFVQSFVTYPTWKTVGPGAFQAYYRELSSRIVRTMVIPGLVEILLTVALLRFRPRAIPAWPIVLALLLNIVRFASTAINQGAVQAQLGDSGLPGSTIDALIRGDYVTQAASISRMLLYLWMMSRIINEPAEPQSRRLQPH